MLRLNEISSQELIWEKPHMLKEEFFLVDQETTLAALYWEKSFGTQARVETANGVWRFRREGFFKKEVKIYMADTEVEIGQVELKGNGTGVVNLADGVSFQWDKNKAWKGSWSFFSATNEPLCSIKAKHSLSRDKAFVKIEPAGANLPDLALLVGLSWYLAILKYKDDSATSAAVTASTTASISS